MPEETHAAGGHANSGRPRAAHTALASLAAIGSLVAASSCCWPILPFVAAAGFAGSSTFLSAARPYLLAISVLLIAYGFYQARQTKRCGRRPRVLSSALLWMSAAFVVMTIFFPQVMANAVANLLAR